MTRLAVGVCASMAMVLLAGCHECLPVASASGISATTARVHRAPSSSANSATPPANKQVGYSEPVSPPEPISVEPARQVIAFVAHELPLSVEAVHPRKSSLQTFSATWRIAAQRYPQRVAICVKPSSAGWSRGKDERVSGRANIVRRLYETCS